MEVDVGATGQMGSLLEEEGVGAVDLADVDGDVLWDVRRGGNEGQETYKVLGRKDRVHDRDVGGGEVGGDGEDEEAGDGRVGVELEAVDILGEKDEERARARERGVYARQRALAMAGTRAGGSDEGGRSRRARKASRTAWSRAAKGE